MRIRVWNAFASNNSGSYVIVGQFPSSSLAAAIAGELGTMTAAHSAWLLARRRNQPLADVSPLAQYAALHGVTYSGSGWDDWPDDPPAVWAVGHQVFVHSDFTLTMPPALGHLIYERGGRVTTEVDHAHNPLVALFEIWWWAPRDQPLDIPARVQDLIDLLHADSGPLTIHRSNAVAPAWRGRLPGVESDDEHHLVIGAIFDDLAAGFTAVGAAVHQLGGRLLVRVVEAGPGDPLAHLRPSLPAPRQPTSS